jgi:hypothetical protein
MAGRAGPKPTWLWLYPDRLSVDMISYSARRENVRRRGERDSIPGTVDSCGPADLIGLLTNYRQCLIVIGVVQAHRVTEPAGADTRTAAGIRNDVENDVIGTSCIAGNAGSVR